MYKPANIREFVTPATLKRTVDKIINGHVQKEVIDVLTIRGKVKYPQGTRELNANGLVVVHKTIEFITWWNNAFTSGDILSINGIDYRIEGIPENVGERGRYAVLTLKKIEGGA